MSPHRNNNRGVFHPECDRHCQRCTKNHQESSQNKQEHHSPTKSNAVACPRNEPGLIRSLAPVRGSTSTSIPPPFHRLGETHSQTPLPRAIVFFLFRVYGIDSGFRYSGKLQVFAEVLFVHRPYLSLIMSKDSPSRGLSRNVVIFLILCL